MSLTALPSDCLLACLARVPYADLRNSLPSTCKSLCDAVTSAVFRKTRETAGWTEWAVFASQYGPSSCCFITASGAHRAARRPNINSEHVMRVSLWSGGDEVVVIECGSFDLAGATMRACSFDPRRNRWREISPFINPVIYAISQYDVAIGALGSSIMVLGGNNSKRAFGAYDCSQDTWSWQAPLPFDSSYSQLVEVGGRLWCYASDDHLQETFVYDPETRSWTSGPRLPFDGLYDEDGRGCHWHTNAVELQGKFCIMGFFGIDYRAFVWDPTSESWDALFPVPPVVAFESSHIDGHLIVCGNHPSGQGPLFDSGDLPAGLFVLSPGGMGWVEWRLPSGFQDPGLRVAAVRLG